MNSRKSSHRLTSFQDLKALLPSLPSPPRPGERDGVRRKDPVPKKEEGERGPQFEEELFTKAMEGVTPIQKDNYVERALIQTRTPECSCNRDDAEALLRLTNLVRYGIGFEVSDTPEYVEGTGYRVHSSFAKRLHRGDYSVQAHLDLHGFNANNAKELFETFLKWAVTTGKTGVLIIHGRGLSSPSEPVLKRKVVEWLTRGPWRKWVVAYSSARRCDGGVGATYVLLRRRPLSKRLKMKKVQTQQKTET